MRTRFVLLAGLAAVALAAASVTAIALSTSAGQPNQASNSAVCRVPALPGTQVTVVLSDMGAMMNGGMMGGRMMLRLAPQTVPAGTVSFLALNHGTVTHELVVLPLASGASAGTRTVGADNRVGEGGSVGEASNECKAGAGEGIAPGDASWVTLTLKPGRYELVCNLPGHYAAGMYGELEVA
jgi:uncharacterized cupredoxin-like copper-binding protein